MSLIDRLNKDFESRVRLGIMSILLVNDWVDFSEMKDLLKLSDGNLASHSKVLESREYIEIKKEFVNRKPKTSYRVTLKGREAFLDHLSALEELLK
ncbi:MAG: transcriptional regulator [Flavobacteriaceae bacterium]|nr:transcriptional regulator [Flavobacteriaceae bacterium]